MFVFGVSVVLALGTGGWLFFQLNHRRGEANAGGNFIGATVAGLIVFVFVFTLLKYVLHLS